MVFFFPTLENFLHLENPGHKEVSLSEDDLQFIKKGLIEEGVNQIVGVKRNQMAVTRQVNQLARNCLWFLVEWSFQSTLDKAQEVQVSPLKEAEVKAIKVHSNSDEEVFLMRDYVLSLQDPFVPLSGNKELLPPDSDVKQISKSTGKTGGRIWWICHHHGFGSPESDGRKDPGSFQ